MVVLLDFLAVPFLLVFMAVTSYEDAYFGRIRNKWILACLLYAVAAPLVQVLFLLASAREANFAYFSVFAGNALAAALLGIALWLGHLWSAADTKLFFAYSLAVPLHWYRNVLFPGFPALSLLVNAVLPLAAFYLVVMAWKLLRAPDVGLLGALRDGLEPGKHAELLLFLFGFSWLAGKALVFALPEGNSLMLIAVMFLLYWLARRSLGAWMLRLSAVAAVLRLMIDSQGVLAPGFLQEFLAMYLLIALGFVVLLNMSSAAFSEVVPAARLHEGMIPAEAIGGIAHRSEGLSADEVRHLKALGKQVRICQSIPFAPFMALGVVLAALLGGDVLLLL